MTSTACAVDILSCASGALGDSSSRPEGHSQPRGLYVVPDLFMYIHMLMQVQYTYCTYVCIQLYTYASSSVCYAHLSHCRLLALGTQMGEVLLYTFSPEASPPLQLVQRLQCCGSTVTCASWMENGRCVKYIHVHDEKA